VRCATLEFLIEPWHRGKGWGTQGIRNVPTRDQRQLSQEGPNLFNESFADLCPPSARRVDRGSSRLGRPRCIPQRDQRYADRTECTHAEQFASSDEV